MLSIANKKSIFQFLIIIILLFSFHFANAQNVSDSLKIEYQKLELEKFKAWLTALSIFIPAIIAIISISWQTRMTSRLKQSDTKTAFQLKAAEIVLNSTGPGAARNRAEVLHQMFKDYLPIDFLSSFDLTILPGTRKQDKLELLKLIITNPSHRDEIIKSWKILFPGDKAWIDEAFKDSTLT